jgi:translation initiation factor IF-1
MPGQEPTELVGTVTQVLTGSLFRVALPTGREVTAQLSGEIRKRFVHLSVGEKVHLQLSPHDPGQARIVFPAGQAPEKSGSTL